MRRPRSNATHTQVRLPLEAVEKFTIAVHDTMWIAKAVSGEAEPSKLEIAPAEVLQRRGQILAEFMAETYPTSRRRPVLIYPIIVEARSREELDQRYDEIRRWQRDVIAYATTTAPRAVRDAMELTESTAASIGED